MSNIALWQPETKDILPVTAKTPDAISKYAVQLATRDKRQIVSAFESGHFEMATSYLWGKTLTALKKELASVGVGLLGEMVGRPDINEDDDIDDFLTARDVIRLAEELGVVSSTDALRLRHTNELVSHFAQLDSDQSDVEEFDETEAVAAFKVCVRGVLGRPKVEVATRFVEFREALERETLREDGQYVEMLRSSPYFFLKLTISVLMNAAKVNIGAQLEHTLANINVVIPQIWERLRDTEKWQVGHAYAEAYADGKTTAVAGLKSALLQVRGFDFVPENLRSETFVRAAAAILSAHDGLNNFYNEVAPVRNLGKLGTTIPTPALPACITALLSVVLGNQWGVAWSAEPEASRLLGKLTDTRWTYYVNNALQSDTRILNKLLQDKPITNWNGVVERYGLAQLQINHRGVSKLIASSTEKNLVKIKSAAKGLLADYYGKAA
ncbi:MAG: hypothetical protein EOM22_00880 [Gammaproteobacteria bacterium]|nr:hypothetical protein [Gammaproteobacteria bacterium]